MGGGKDTDEGFIWQSKNANGGDFVVLRASGDDAYNTYIYGLAAASGHPLNSVTTVLVKNKKASEETAVLDMIRNAEAIFFAGGDQGDYMDYFVGTDVQSIIQSKLTNTTVGGTSAGLAVLGNYVYTAEKGSIESDGALANPYDREITIAPAFLKIPFMETIITDTHFVTRNRMGRMLTFVARDLQDDAQMTLSRGVGVDEHTALLLDVTTGDVTTVGQGTAYVCTSDHDPEVCKDKTPLTFHNIACTRLSATAGDTYSFKTFTAAAGSGVDYVNDVTAGILTDFPYGPSV
jgi:cyanophycinase